MRRTRSFAKLRGIVGVELESRARAWKHCVFRRKLEQVRWGLVVRSMERHALVSTLE